jgi:hypothetical protein
MLQRGRYLPGFESMTFDTVDSTRATACNWAIFSTSCNAPREIGPISAYLRVIDCPISCSTWKNTFLTRASHLLWRASQGGSGVRTGVDDQDQPADRRRNERVRQNDRHGLLRRLGSRGEADRACFGPAHPDPQRLVIDRQLHRDRLDRLHCDGYSPWWSKTIRMAPFPDLGRIGARLALLIPDIAPSSQGKEQSPILGRFTQKW